MAEFNVSVHPHTLEDRETIVDFYSAELAQHYDDPWVASGTKAEAIEQLNQLILDAQQAIVKLQNLQPCPHEWEETVWMPDHKQEIVTNAGTTRVYRCRICEDHVTRVVDRSTAAPWFAEQYYGVKTG